MKPALATLLAALSLATLCACADRTTLQPRVIVTDPEGAYLLDVFKLRGLPPPYAPDSLPQDTALHWRCRLSPSLSLKHDAAGIVPLYGLTVHCTQDAAPLRAPRAAHPPSRQ